METYFWYRYVALASGCIVGIIFSGNFIFSIDKQVLIGLLQFASVIVAIATIIISLNENKYQRKRDRSMLVTDLISLFRTDILKLHGDFAEIIRKEVGSPNHEFITVELKDGSLSSLISNQRESSKKQIEFLMKNNATSIACLNLCNALEEYAIRVDELDAFKDEKLAVTKTAFIRAVEEVATFILFQRDLIQGNNMYANTLNLYFVWEPQIDKIKPEERLKKFINTFD